MSKAPLARQPRRTRLLAASFLLASCVETGAPGGPPAAPGAAREPAFATGALCARCHSASPWATALRNELGDDVSPHGLWQATPMANAQRDPFFRAQFARELEAAPAAQAELGQLCLRCHTPLAHHQARLDGAELASFAELEHDAFARDGVSCTLCHQARPEELGLESSFGGRLEVRDEHRIYGPYPDPLGGPMRMQTGFAPEQGLHIRESALCGACHTLETRPAPAAPPFLEQSPYLEWLDSEFNGAAGARETARSCQECHMSDAGAMRIARAPGGGDFNLPARPGVRAHGFTGGNAFLLRLLRANRAELGVEAPAEALERAERSARRQLALSTARVEVLRAVRRAGQLDFDVRVENLTGHKFPAGYPARRAWLEIEVRAGGRTLFRSGGADERGRLLGVRDERRMPHVDRLVDPSQVVVYEMRAVDEQGSATTQLSHMARVEKDTRLLPRGWRADGPHAERTRPVGVEGDADFAGGEDLVHCAVPLSPDVNGRLTIYVDLWYQSIPPGWVDDLRALAALEAQRFVRLYDAAGDPSERVAQTALTLD